MALPTSIADPTEPLQVQIPAFPYQQYIDDSNIVAFFDAYNELAQPYLDWSNATPLGVYTSPAINGALLDWIGLGIYGIPRPVFSTLATLVTNAAIDTLPINTIAIDGSSLSVSGSAQVANDDFYKRTLTYCTYTGDGRNSNLMVIRRRVARFLYGANGGDITIDLAQNVNITASSNAMTITIPAGQASEFFQQGFGTGFLQLPFMLDVTITVL